MARFDVSSVTLRVTRTSCRTSSPLLGGRRSTLGQRRCLPSCSNNGYPTPANFESNLSVRDFVYRAKSCRAKPRRAEPSQAGQLGNSSERVRSIILEDLDMRKLSAKWVPKCLNADQKRQRCQSSEQFWTFLARSK